jgi:hypothetical protein
MFETREQAVVRALWFESRLLALTIQLHIFFEFAVRVLILRVCIFNELL